MNILGIDYGKKRIGLAWVQGGLDVVLPFGVTQEDKIPALIKEEGIGKVIVGLPIGLDGEENENTSRVRAFVEGFKKHVDVPVEFIDERFTSQQADRMEGGEATRDEKSAMVILQSYLDKK